MIRVDKQKLLHEKLLNNRLAMLMYRKIQNNFKLAFYNKRLYSKESGINQFHKGLDAILKFSNDLDDSISYVHELYYSYIAARKGKMYSNSEEPSGEVLENVIEMFQAAKLNDELLNNYVPIDNVYSGPTYKLLENYFFGRKIDVGSFSFTQSDIELMDVVLKDDDKLIQETEWTHSLRLIYNLTESANVLGMQKVNYLAREHIKNENMNFDNFFLFRAKVVDFGKNLACYDENNKLPKGKAQRFIEYALKINQEDYY